MAQDPKGISIAQDEQKKSDDVDPVEKEFGDPFSWQDPLVDMLEDEFVNGAMAQGWDEGVAEGWFNSQKVNLVNYLQDEVIPQIFVDPVDKAPGGPGGHGIPTAGPALGDPTLNVRNISILANIGRNWLSGLSPDVRNAFQAYSGGGGGGGRGRSGPVKPTPEQIRNQFDVDQLTQAAADQWRGTLLDRPKDPAGIAKAYVEAVVASGGEKKIDFATFVDQRIEKDPRYKMLYANKPPGLSNAQFMQPYVNQAQQVLRPQNVGETARAGAQLGSSPGAFRDRLARSEETTSSAPFITNMEARMTDLGKVFRG